MEKMTAEQVEVAVGGKRVTRKTHQDGRRLLMTFDRDIVVEADQRLDVLAD